MKVKRETPMRRSGDRRRGKGKAVRERRRAADVTAARRARARAAKAAAPTREPRVAQSGPQTAPIPRPAQRSARPTSTSQAKARAKARKAKAPKVVRIPLRDRLAARLASIDLRPRTLASKVPFVVLVIGSLGVGLGVTLWLSTDSAERSYELGNAREKTRMLQQQKEALERDVLQAQSAPALAEAARNLGMIPSKDTAHLVQDPTGNWVVVGTPKPAEGVPPPPLNTKLPEEKTAPRPAPPMNSAEVPVRVLPGTGAPTPNGPSGPEVLVRAPDGATTLGTQHLPGQPGPSGPGAPDAPAPRPGPLAPNGAPVGAPPAGAPAAVPGDAPLAAMPSPAAGVAVPAVPVPAPAASPLAAVPSPPAATPGAPAPAAAASGEQFGPVTITTPGAAR